MKNPINAYQILKNADLPSDQANAIAEAIGSIVEDNNLQHLENLATKDDLAAFATKSDIAVFATKSDIAAFATKNDIAVFATKSDLAAFATKNDLAVFANKTELALAALNSKIDLQIARLETKIAETKSELLRWMFVFWVGQAATTIALVRLIK